MPKLKVPEFKCPRCAYTTPYSTAMKKHLYKLKNSCPASASDIELTPELKQRILNDRVLSLQATTRILNQQQQIATTINNNNTTTTNNNHITNNHNHYTIVIQQHLANQPLINNLDLYSRLNHLSIDNMEDRAKIACENLGWYDMKNNRVKDAHHVIKEESCMNLFETLSSRSDDQKKIACIIKEPSCDLYSVHDGNTYVKQTELETMQSTISSVRRVFFDEYEKTLIRKKDDNALDEHQRLRCYNILKAYYLLLNAFDMFPCSSNFDEEVWAKMLHECEQQKIAAMREQFSRIVRENAESCGNHYNNLLRQFFNKMIINVVCT